MKFCPKCALDLEDHYFSKSKNTKTGLQVYCKECRAIIHHDRREQRRVYDRRHGIEMHGITELEYDNAARQYENKCWLCGNRYEVIRRGLMIDHAHSCEFQSKHKHFSHTEYGCRACIRGLLCYSCNRYVVPFLEKEQPEHPYLIGRPFAKGKAK